MSLMSFEIHFIGVIVSISYLLSPAHCTAEFLGFTTTTWRFMGSYRWGNTSPRAWVVTMIVLLFALIIHIPKP